MSEEEKEAINNLRFYSTNVGFSKYDGTTCVLRAKDVQIVLNLIGKQYAELNSLKEIEQLHKEENGKLRVENKILNRRINDAFDRGYIHKDKIRDMMKYREFELQQEYKEFEEDVEWRTYKKILEGK